MSRSTLLLWAIIFVAPPAFAADEATSQDKNRVLWVFPNNRTVAEQDGLPRLAPRDKLTLALKDSFDPYAFPVAGMFAGIAHWQNQPESWGRGWRGYGNRYLGALADQTMSNAMSEAVFPIALHQDPRYFRLGKGGFWRRSGYALTRVFLTRSDAGRPQFNYSEFGGNAVMAGASTLYYPREDRTAGNVAVKWGLQLAVDMLADVGKEFWPDAKLWLTGRP